MIACYPIKRFCSGLHIILHSKKLLAISVQRIERRYDLDWWRVISIFAVYLHHIGMPFNGDQFHIMNSESSKFLDDVMVFFEQIRLPLLFFVSGAGTIFAFSKKTWYQFVGERAYRLLIPLTFGVFFIVPPQHYFENIEQYSSYFQLYPGAFTDLDANHLWFIENLFYISILCLPIILFFKSHWSKKSIDFIEEFASKKFGVFLWVIPLIVIHLISKKYFPDNSKDITNLSSTLFYSYFFIAGLIITSAEKIWGSLKIHKSSNFRIAIICIVIFYTYYFLPSEWASRYLSLTSRWNIWHVVSVSVSWSLIITALGYGQVWFKEKNNLIVKLNEAIYPFYILHQTVIVILAFYVVQLDISISFKMLLLLVTSFPIIAGIYRLLIYPFNVTRILFGMKLKRKKNEKPS